MGNIFKICSNVFDYCDNYLFEDKDDKDNNVFRSIIPSDESLELDLDELDELNDDYSENVIIDDEVE